MFTQKKLRFTLVILALWLLLAPAALAQDGTPEPPADDPVIVVEEAPAESPTPTENVGMTPGSVVALILFLLSFFPLVGGGAGVLISVVVNVFKAFKVLPDGWAAAPLLVLNFAAIAVIYFALGLKPGEAIPADLDTTLRQMAEIIALGLELVGGIGGGALFHNKLMKPMSPRFSYSSQAPKSWTATSAVTSTARPQI